jgi:hypothetical protein
MAQRVVAQARRTTAKFSPDRSQSQIGKDVAATMRPAFVKRNPAANVKRELKKDIAFLQRIFKIPVRDWDDADRKSEVGGELSVAHKELKAAKSACKPGDKMTFGTCRTPTK